MAKKPTKGDQTTRPYKVLKRLRHDGEDYTADDLVALTEGVAADLARLGIVGRDPVADAPIDPAGANGA